MFAYFTVCSRCTQLGQKINAVTGLYTFNRFFMKLFKTSNGNCELLSKTVRLWPTKHIIETALWKMYCYFVTLFFCCTQLSLLVKVFFILYCTTFMVNKDEYIYCVEWPIEWSFSITQHVNDLDDTTWTPKYLTFSHQTISRLSEVSKLLHGCLYREPNLVQTDFLALIAISKDCSSDWQTFISPETLAF